MNHPPPGYDDQSVIPKSRLKTQLDRLENELNVIQKIFSQSVPGEFHENTQVSNEFWNLRATAEELGAEYTFLIEKLIHDYENFHQAPDSAKLEQLFSDIKSLQLLLVNH